MKVLTPDYEPEGNPSALTAVFVNKDAARKKIPIALVLVA